MAGVPRTKVESATRPRGGGATSPRSRWPHVLFASHCATTLYCVAGPGFRQWASSARPFVLGLPWPIAWVLLWLLLTVVALFLYWRWYEHGPARDE